MVASQIETPRELWGETARRGVPGWTGKFCHDVALGITGGSWCDSAAYDLASCLPDFITWDTTPATVGEVKGSGQGKAVRIRVSQQTGYSRLLQSNGGLFGHVMYVIVLYNQRERDGRRLSRMRAHADEISVRRFLARNIYACYILELCVLEAIARIEGIHYCVFPEECRENTIPEQCQSVLLGRRILARFSSDSAPAGFRHYGLSSRKFCAHHVDLEAELQIAPLIAETATFTIPVTTIVSTILREKLTDHSHFLPPHAFCSPMTLKRFTTNADEDFCEDF